MRAQPVEDGPRDPQVILWALPDRERPEFLRQYREAVDAAREDVARYRDLSRLLLRWSLVVEAVSQPGYYEAIEDARHGIGRTVPLDEAITTELSRRR
ncbi:hypothetical protein SAMN05421505_15317 [Sinosporangium album]|uniref:Uncharacterized protein n=1 Tax=Sinosporangium album TaxID=504805 RepID=A0A1G8KPZ4_9ACTN|nr:DUF6247 family protein [Sinosporangium album]SDI45446.1 hypothetical protein SAMN05421505_15317 [Sinosporangium album]